ncbi:MAG TPA: DUF2090 domain-containing protein, partial [Steroidobacteraceae bacterium]|nr:DUF2090 domain-containing protein [Steroidobacteraceae bacterium]
RELLIEVRAGRIGEVREGAAPRALARLYELGIRPEWWSLAPQPGASGWESCAQAIAAKDPYCRGVLVALDEAGTAAAALEAAAGFPIVRGFIAGGSIFVDAGPEPAVREIAEHLRALLGAWISARDPRLDRPERSGH